VLRDRGLSDPELLLNDASDVARRRRAIGEELEDAPPNRVSEDIERVHELDYKDRVI
jgi:hypothetical protein